MLAGNAIIAPLITPMQMLIYCFLRRREIFVVVRLRRNVPLNPIKKAANDDDRCNFDRARLDECQHIVFQIINPFDGVVDEAIPRTVIRHYYMIKMIMRWTFCGRSCGSRS